MVLERTSGAVLNDTTATIHQLAKGDPDVRSRPLVIGNKVFDVLPTTSDLIDFTRPKYLLLQFIYRDVPLTEASEKCGLTVEASQSFLETQKAKDYLEKKRLASIIAQETKNEDNWWVEIHQVRAGEKVLNKGQMVALQAAGDRVAPKRNDVNVEKTKVVIQFNFSPEDVKEAFRRQDVIDAEWVHGD